VRKTLRYLEEDQLVLRGAVRERAKDVAAVAAAEGSEAAPPPAARTYNVRPRVAPRPPRLSARAQYVCIDYPRFVDVVGLRLHTMRAALAAEAEDAKLVQEFVCTTPRCNGRRYSSLDAAQIIHPITGEFHCEDCGLPLAQDVGQGEAGDGTERKRRKDEARLLLARMEEQLRPLHDALARARASGADPPDYGSLEEWVAGRREQALLEAKQARAAAARGAAAGKRGRGVFDYLEDTEFDVQLEGEEEAVGVTGGAAAPAQPPQKRQRHVANPPWLVRKAAPAAAAPAAAVEARPSHRQRFLVL